MIKSMTGFGQASGGKSPFHLAVEIRSWNHRFFEFSSRLPSCLAELEEKIRDLVYARMKRGKITLSVSLKNGASDLNGLVLDEAKIDFYLGSIRKVQKKYGLKDSISINTLFSIPNLFTMDRSAQSASVYWVPLKKVLDEALKRLESAKAKEGAALGKDLKKRADRISEAIDQIEHAAKELPAQRRLQLSQRIQELTRGIDLDSERLEREVALVAERSDVTEEIVRTRHHLEMIKASLSGSGEAGKKLDFIAQEIHRETNTIGSKAQHPKIAEEIIRIKGELEKIREQVQNIE